VSTRSRSSDGGLRIHPSTRSNRPRDRTRAGTVSLTASIRSEFSQNCSWAEPAGATSAPAFHRSRPTVHDHFNNSATDLGARQRLDLRHLAARIRQNAVGPLAAALIAGLVRQILANPPRKGVRFAIDGMPTVG